MLNEEETNSNISDEETAQVPVLDEENPDSQPEEKKPHRRIGRLIGLGLLAVIVLAALGGLGGYLTAIQDRETQAESIVSTEIADQFLLGLIDFERGNYEVAMQRFEYILKIDPNNTAAAEKLTQTILKMNELSILPTIALTATPSPTPDERNQAELFNNALSYRDQQEWTALIETLDTLRLQDPEYRAVELDGLYYLAYRNRGLQRIQQEGNLEGGIFDLNRAELFGLLDIEASNYREWASKYITGMSFWGVDWGQVVNYFGPLGISAPFLSDSNFFTAQDRLATAQVEVNQDVLARARSRYVGGKYCDSYDLFNQASAYIQLSPEDANKMAQASDRCFGVEETAAPTETVTP
jgi:tetratricopeptide (TPR) repeat protein